MFRYMVFCVSSFTNIWSGNTLSGKKIMDMKWFLNVCMDLLELLVQCMPMGYI